MSGQAYPSPAGLGAFLLFGLNQQAAKSFSATIAQNLGGLNQQFIGSDVVAGTIAQTLGGLRQTVIGAEVFGATITQHLSGLRQSFAASVSIVAATSQHLGGLRQSLVGSDVAAAAITQQLSGLRQSIAATSTKNVAVSIAQRLGGLSQAISATSTNVAPFVPIPQPIPRRSSVSSGGGGGGSSGDSSYSDGAWWERRERLEAIARAKAEAEAAALAAASSVKFVPVDVPLALTPEPIVEFVTPNPTETTSSIPPSSTRVDAPQPSAPSSSTASPATAAPPRSLFAAIVGAVAVAGMGTFLAKKQAQVVTPNPTKRAQPNVVARARAPVKSNPLPAIVVEREGPRRKGRGSRRFTIGSDVYLIRWLKGHAYLYVRTYEGVDGITPSGRSRPVFHDAYKGRIDDRIADAPLGELTRYLMTNGMA
jgi:hypothetical protein